MDFLLAALCGIGIGMLWQRADPVKPFRQWVVIRLNRLHDRLVVKRLPRYPVWWLKGVLACESCLAPWLAAASGPIFGLGWYSFAAIPIAFAIYHLLTPAKPQQES